MVKADAIIFDKDGTLLDFDAFWVTVSVKAVEEVLEWAGDSVTSVSDVLHKFGVRNGVTDINGVLCKGTYEELGRILYDIMRNNGCVKSCAEVTEALVTSYNKNSDAGEIKPTCENLAFVLSELKKQNKKLAVVTTDNPEITIK